MIFNENQIHIVLREDFVIINSTANDLNL